MSRKKNDTKIEDTIAPNLIPLVDIMFLLLLFFMLGADMTQREQSDLILPTATMVKESDPNKVTGERLVTINVHHNPAGRDACPVYANDGICREDEHWKWAIRGRDYDREGLKEQLAIEAQLAMQSAPDPVAGKILSDLKVLVRADARAPFGDVQKVIEYAGTASIFKIEVGAAKPAEEVNK